MRINLGKNKKCAHCGGKPVLHVVPLYGLVGLVCRRCSPMRCKVFTSMAKARKHWNSKNKWRG